MDESWNFLKEAPECELALVIDACKKSSIDIPTEATAMDIIDSISKKFNNDTLSYEQFLNEVCRQNALSNIDDFSVEDKGLELLGHFLSKGIESMSEDQIKRFAFDYCFSNLDKEKLVREVGVRLKTSNKFRAKLFHIVPAFWEIDFTRIFPSDVSDVTELILKDDDISKIYGPVIATLIALQNKHNLPNSVDDFISEYLDYDYIPKYLDKIIQEDTSFNDKRRAILSVMLCFVKNTSESNNENKCKVFNKVSSFLDDRILTVPDYIIKHGFDRKGIVEHLMDLLNSCDDNVYGYYTQIMSQDLLDFQSIAFFDYRFPYTPIIEEKDSYFLMPDNELDQLAVKLYLLSHEINPNECLLSENELRNKSLDCAIIPMNSNPADYQSFPNYIQLENPFITGFRDFLQTLGTFDDSSVQIINALKGFVQLDCETMDRLAAEMDKKARDIEALEGLNQLVHLICNLRNK